MGPCVGGESVGGAVCPGYRVGANVLVVALGGYSGGRTVISVCSFDGLQPKTSNLEKNVIVFFYLKNTILLNHHDLFKECFNKKIKY